MRTGGRGCPELLGRPTLIVFPPSFADATPTALLFAPTWNEFAATAHPMAGWDMDNPFFYASGAQARWVWRCGGRGSRAVNSYPPPLPQPDDPQRSVLVYDGFTSERRCV